jgi:DNA-binding NtrC family response regulator
VSVEPRAMALLQAYAWPGNVRELRNIIERATIVAEGRFIEVADLPPLAGGERGAQGSGTGLTPGTTVAEVERQLIFLTLQHTGGNKTRAAEMLGISLKTLHNKLNRLADEDKGADRGAADG